jgi:hypothetical protein
MAIKKTDKVRRVLSTFKGRTFSARDVEAVCKITGVSGIICNFSSPNGTCEVEHAGYLAPPPGSRAKKTSLWRVVNLRPPAENGKARVSKKTLDEKRLLNDSKLPGWRSAFPRDFVDPCIKGTLTIYEGY